jgi:glycerol kinase
LESLAYQSSDVLKVMEEDSGIMLTALKVDGGACVNNFLMQFQADIINVPVKRPISIETTALGAAYLAGLATGYWKSREEIIENWRISRIFEPEMDADLREELLHGWRKAVKTSFGWSKQT